MLYCGIKETDITPKPGLPVPGQLYIRLSDSLKDRLHAKAAAIDDGTAAFIVLALDILAIDAEDADQIRQRIAAGTGVPTAAILVAATHTHTGAPAVAAYGHEKDSDFIAQMIAKAADTGISAWQERRPALMSVGKTPVAGWSFNRRFQMKDGSFRTNPGYHNPLAERAVGPIDPDLAVLKITDTAGMPLAAIVNFACHLDIVGGAGLSADYPGELSRCLKDRYGDAFITLFLTGTCGNINHVDINNEATGRPGHYLELGRHLAGSILQLDAWVPIDPQQPVQAGCERLQASPRKPDEQQLARAQSCLADESAGVYDRFFARELLVAAAIYTADEELDVQVCRIGPFALVGLPGEVFVEFGLAIKEQFGLPVSMVATLANGNYGYVATREAFAQGGYETMFSTYTRLAPETGYQLVKSAVRIMDHLKRNDYEKEISRPVSAD